MAQVNDTDTLLVNRSDTSYQVQAQNLMAELQDTDLMLVNRAGTSYKATGLEIKESLKPPADINEPTIFAPADGAGIGGADTYTPKTSAINDVDTSDGSWKLITPLPTWFSSHDWTNIVYGLDGFVIVGDGANPAAALSSDGGQNWQLANTSNTTGIWRALTYGQGKYVAVGGSYAMYSTNGINWTNSTGIAPPPFEGASFKCIAFGDNHFVAVGQSMSYTANSTNGTSWSHAPDPSWGLDQAERNGHWQDVTYGLGDDGIGRFVACGSQYSKRIMYSEDKGASWTLVDVPQKTWGAIAYGNGIFTVVSSSASDDAIMYSTNGIDWTEGNTGITKVFTSIVFANGQFMAAGNNTSTMSSTDGIYWVEGPSAASSASWQGIAYGSDNYVAVSEHNLMESENGTGLNLSSLTFANANTYSNETGNDTGQPISETFTAGQTVTGVKVGSNSAAGKLVNDASGNTMIVVTLSGAFVDGMEVINDAQSTQLPPEAGTLEFVGSTPVSDPVDGVLTWGNATWEIATNSGFTSPMFGLKMITPGSNQTLLPNERGAIVLEDDTEYWARLSYNATDPSLPNVASSAVHFKTASASAPPFSAPDIYYDTDTNTSITGNTIVNRYGINPATDNIKRLGIAELTEQPSYPVAGYQAVGDKYQPIEDQSNYVDELETTISTAQASVTEFQARVDKLRSQLSLPATPEVPQAINGFYPLYTSEVESDLVSDNSQSHEHELDGVTYYMPDAGVTLYHGTYDETTESTEESSGSGY